MQQHEQLAAYVEGFLGPLSERERQVVILRVGLDRGHPRTLAEVAKELDVSGPRIAQIQGDIIRKLSEYKPRRRTLVLA